MLSSKVLAVLLCAGSSFFLTARAGAQVPPPDTTSPKQHVLAPVIVGASRVERRVQDEPERVEVLSGEDVGEKTVMHPASPTTLLSEMPGVRVQTTSPGLGGAGVRLQGLRGRYTLLLADGLPLYGATRAGLEIFHTGRQSLEDDPYRKVSVPYTTVGVLVGKKIARVSMFANGENLTGVRQTRFDPLLLPAQRATGDWTASQWAPL